MEARRRGELAATDRGTDRHRRTRGAFPGAWVRLRLAPGMMLISLVSFASLRVLCGGFAFAQGRPVASSENGDVRRIVEGPTAALRNLPSVDSVGQALSHGHFYANQTLDVGRRQRGKRMENLRWVCSAIDRTGAIRRIRFKDPETKKRH